MTTDGRLSALAGAALVAAALAVAASCAPSAPTPDEADDLRTYTRRILEIEADTRRRMDEAGLTDAQMCFYAQAHAHRTDRSGEAARHWLDFHC